MSRLFYIVVFVLLAGCSGKQLGDDHTDGAPVWGAPVNGLQVGISRRKYDEGKQPDPQQNYYVVQVRNVSKGRVKVLRPVEPRWGEAKAMLSGDESARLVINYDSSAGLKTGTFKPSVKPLLQEMEAGEILTMELRLSPSRFEMQKFVGGRLSATYSNQQSTIDYGSAGTGPVSGIWTGEATSGSVAVE